MATIWREFEISLAGAIPSAVGGISMVSSARTAQEEEQRVVGRPRQMDAGRLVAAPKRVQVRKLTVGRW